MEQREQSVDYEDVTHDINMTITESDADRNYQQIKRQVTFDCLIVLLLL